jgi:small conductance mechanosensitive channel
MEQESTVDTETLTGFSRKVEEFIGQINQYVDLFFGSFFVIMVGIIAIYLIHKTAAKIFFPHFGKGRLIKVTGVTIYALILLAAALIVLGNIGIDVSGIGHIALVTIFLLAVLAFFLLPFLPRLPFKIGHLVDVRGELGTVIAISPLFTTLQKFDGAMVFIPNTSIISMTMKNYSQVSSSRIEINLSVQNDMNLERTIEALVRLMTEDERVFEEPSRPAVFVLNANADCIHLLAVCWVKNKDWYTTKSDLWEKIVTNINEDVHLAKLYPTAK